MVRRRRWGKQGRILLCKGLAAAVWVVQPPQQATVSCPASHTTVAAPPLAGTGKTDTAVQIMHILYHNCPSQRTLVVTHSNQALNDLFTKARRAGGGVWQQVVGCSGTASCCLGLRAAGMWLNADRFAAASGRVRHPTSVCTCTHGRCRRLWSATCRHATCCAWAWARRSWRRSWTSGAHSCPAWIDWAGVCKRQAFWFGVCAAGCINEKPMQRTMQPTTSLHPS